MSASGAIVADRYSLEGLIGCGGVSTVYRVRRRHLGSLHVVTASRRRAVEVAL